MYIIKATTDPIFWNQDNGNFPSQEIINNLNFNIDIDGINFINYSNASIASEIDNLTYIRVEGGNHTLFYYVDVITKRADKNVNVYSLTLDYYTSLVLKWVNKNGDNLLYFLRTNKYENKCLEYGDVNIDGIPKYYDGWSFGRVVFEKVVNNNITYFYNNQVALKYSNTDILNAHKYYVFSTGQNGGFQFLPILSQTNNVVAITGLNVPDYSKLLYEASFKNYVFYKDPDFGGDKSLREISAEVGFKIREAIANKKPVTYWANIQTPNLFLTPTYQQISGNNFVALPENVVLQNDYYFAQGVIFRYVNQFVRINNQQVISRYSGNQGASNWGALDNLIWQSENLLVRIYDTKIGGSIETEVANSIINLESLRTHQELSNRFVGIFYLPHVLQIGDLWEYQIWQDGKKYLTLNLKAEGHDLTQFECGVLQKDMSANEFNETHINPFIFRYFNKKYFGNMIPLEFYVEDNGSIIFGGKLFFSNGGTITCPLDLLSVTETTINYGYQLPIGINNYLNYVNANLNTINTSYDIQKQNHNIKQGEIIAGGVFDYLGAANQISGSIDDIVTRGDASGVMNASLGYAKNLTGSIFAGIKNNNALNNWKAMTKAQYQDLRNTTGNSIVMSNIQDATNLLLYDSNTEQFSGYEFCKLSKDTLKNINNYLYLFGYPLVHCKKLNDFISEGIQVKNNAYIELESLFLNAGIGIDFSGFLKFEISIIKEMLISGFRIWGVKPQRYVSKIQTKK